MARAREHAQPLGHLEPHGYVLQRGSGFDGTDGIPTLDFRERQLSATVAHSETRPENEYAALMQCAPGDMPDTPLDSLLPLRDIIGDALDALTEREQWIFDSLIVRRLSLRQLASELGLSKTHVARLREEILTKLQEALQDNPTIMEYLCH